MIPCDIELLGEDIGGGQVAGTFPTIEALQKDAQRYLKEHSFLKRVIREVEDRYDWIVIDCPPNLYLMTRNALYASDYYVVTAIPDHLSTIGLNILTQKIGEMAEGISAIQTLVGASDSHTVAELGAIVFVKVRIGGSMITTTHSTTIRNIASRPFAKGKVVSKYTTELIGYSEAAESRVPVWEHNTENARRAARKNEYPEITRELFAMLRETP